MTDLVPPSPGRRRIMQAIRSKDTKPELLVRKFLHHLGYRYRLHAKNLPGRPDIIFPARRKAIFIHGCFWHAHEAPHCRNGQRPRTNPAYWDDKLRRNRERDATAIDKLADAGWDVLVIWECDLNRWTEAETRLIDFLGPSGTASRKATG